MKHNDMYLSLPRLICMAALCASGCSEAHHGTAQSIDSGLTDAAMLVDGSARRGVLDAQGEPPAIGDEDSGARFEQPLSEPVAAALKHCSITPVSAAETTAVDVPSDFRGAQASQFWPLSEACVAGGWDLARCAGQTAQVTSVRTDEVTPWGPDTRYIANVIALDNGVCCVSLGVEGAVLAGAPPAAPCGPAFAARDAMRRCNIIESPGDSAQAVEEVTVPTKPSDDRLWRERASVCHDGEYDLAKCAGETATLVSVNENTTLDGPNPKRAWILSHESEICCIWETDGAAPPKLLARKCAPQ